MTTTLRDPSSALPRPRSRNRRFATLVVVLVVSAAGYVAWAADHSHLTPTGGGVVLPAGAPALLFQNLTDGDGNGQVAVAPLGDPAAAHSLTGLRCDRVHYAAGHGLCLAADDGFPPVEYAMVFGPDFRVTHRIPLDGLPSRTRVSPDGRYGAATVFVTGHSYSEDGFSTNTTLIDMAAGTSLGNLEEFTIMKAGRTYTAPDVNFWGVTFATDSNRFYATLATGGRTYLVEGDAAARRVVVGRENVECPSLSPDGTRLGFKKRMDDGSGSPVWRFHVLDLRTNQETPLAEARSIDDQVEWLDDRTLLYGSSESPQEVLAVPADGTGAPHTFLGRALSPTVLRTPLPDASVASLATGPRVMVAAVDLRVNASAPDQVARGVSVRHTITVTNHGPGGASGVVADDVVRGGTITAATADTPPGAGGHGCAVFATENRAHCDVPLLPEGASWTVTITVTPSAPGDVEGRPLVSAAEPDPANDPVAVLRTAAA
jgi:hypothetical protein